MRKCTLLPRDNSAHIDAKIKKKKKGYLQIPSADKDAKAWKFHTLLVGMKDAIATLENSSVFFFYKVKHVHHTSQWSYFYTFPQEK